MTSSLTEAFIAVARKSAEVLDLREALETGLLSVSAANRIVSTLNKENAAELIQFVSTHSWRESEREIAKRNPKAAAPDKVKMISKDLVQLTITVSLQDYEDFERVASLEAQRTGKNPSKAEVLRAENRAYLDKHDPVRRAERIQKKKQTPSPEQVATVSNSVRTEFVPTSTPEKSMTYGKRVPLTAAQKRAVLVRDQGRCTHVDEHGRRCNQDRWIDVHHIVEVSRGGTNDPENLATLCSFHHDLVHQLSLPIDGQINWLRSPSRPYGKWVGTLLQLRGTR